MANFLKAGVSLTSLLGATILASSPVYPQEAPNRPQDVTVTGRPVPQAEAPRSATCEMLAKDSYFRALLGVTESLGLLSPPMYMPTRLPRNPDYTAPPAVLAGSALPELPKSRFGVRDLVMSGSSDAQSSGGADTSADSGNISAELGDFRDAKSYCRSLYERNGGTFVSAGNVPNEFDADIRSAGFPTAASSNLEKAHLINTPEARLAQARARFSSARAMIVDNDKTLPMAFALFDQGRYAESLGWFRKAATKLEYRNGGDEAALFIGKLYLQGLGDKSDTAEALKWLKKTATMPFNPILETSAFDPKQPERNTAVGEAAVILANLYRTGFRGVPKDLSQARRWYERAFAVGHVPAAKTLGDMSLDGIGGERSPKQAVAYYRQAAKLGHYSAEVALADILFTGDEGVAQNRKEALGWYQAAAKGQHAGALYALGRAYDLGEGVQADPKLAMGFYKSAALGGDAAAMAAMGTYFYEGKLLPKDNATARRWFEAAAAASNSDGMFNLAAMLANSEGGPKDMVKAWALLKQAAALGHPNAPRALAALERRMTPQERNGVSI